jgi:tetratricopeptide (TPR) repeat protein
MSYTDSKFKLAAGLLVTGLVLSGCGSSGGSADGTGTSTTTNKAKSSVNKKVYTAESGLTPRQRFSKALEKLENGEDGQALAELNAYLLDVPRSNSAKNLVAQISTDSSEYFPADYFTVNLTSGASLSTLAKKYLGSALKFYALAKYNNISNPSRVNIGQEIKIPLTQLARTQREKDNNPEIEAPEQEVAKVEEVMEGEIEAIQEDTETVVENTIDPQNEPVLAEEIPVVPEDTAESVIADLQMLTQEQNYAGAIEKLAKLKTFGKLGKASQELALQTYLGRAKEISETDATLAATFYAEAGKLNLINEQNLPAFENFKMATDLDESNDQAMEEMLVLQKEIADKYHREASSAFRRQELDIAIEKWDMVLKVNPDHSSAKLYRAQALELKEKLYNINQN